VETFPAVSVAVKVAAPAPAEPGTVTTTAKLPLAAVVTVAVEVTPFAAVNRTVVADDGAKPVPVTVTGVVVPATLLVGLVASTGWVTAKLPISCVIAPVARMLAPP